MSNERLNPRITQATLELLQGSQRTTGRFGDVIYTSPNTLDFNPGYPFEPGAFRAVFSPRGEDLLFRNPHILSLLDQPPVPFARRALHVPPQALQGDEGWCTREILVDGANGLSVAVKRIFSETPSLPGFDQYYAMRALQRAGVVCAEPLMATEWNGVYEFVEAQEIGGYTSDFRDFIRLLEKLHIDSLWRDGFPHTVIIDGNHRNYRINPYADGELLHAFIALDPVVLDYSLQ